MARDVPRITLRSGTVSPVQPPAKRPPAGRSAARLLWRRDGRIVLAGEDRCAGCRQCQALCPGGAPQFNPAARKSLQQAAAIACAVSNSGPQAVASAFRQLGSELCFSVLHRAPRASAALGRGSSQPAPPPASPAHRRGAGVRTSRAGALTASAVSGRAASGSSRPASCTASPPPGPLHDARRGPRPRNALSPYSPRSPQRHSLSGFGFLRIGPQPCGARLRNPRA